MRRANFCNNLNAVHAFLNCSKVVHSEAVTVTDYGGCCLLDKLISKLAH